MIVVDAHSWHGTPFHWYAFKAYGFSNKWQGYAFKAYPYVPLNERAREDAQLVRDAMSSIHLNLGDEIVGYAIVAWSKDGNMQTGMYCGPGPIGPAMVPPLAASALGQHVSFEAIDETLIRGR